MKGHRPPQRRDERQGPERREIHLGELAGAQCVDLLRSHPGAGAPEVLSAGQPRQRRRVRGALGIPALATLLVLPAAAARAWILFYARDGPNELRREGIPNRALQFECARELAMLIRVLLFRDVDRTGHGR
jgi:hypothetical protein